MFSKIKKHINFLLVFVIFINATFLIPIYSNSKHFISNEVIPIDWTALDEIKNPDDEFILIEEIMDNSTNYILNTWFEENNYIESDIHIDFKGTEEFEIRGPAMVSLGLSIPIATGSFNENKIGMTYEEAIDHNIYLITSLAASHVSNIEEGWGLQRTNDTNDWQTPLWSYYVGFSGWLLWDKLEEEDKMTIQNMVVSEANNIPSPRYYKDKNGQILYEDNTQAEENSSWASLLGLAVSMMPKHENAEKWVDQLIDLSVIAFSRPSDINSTKVYNERELNDILEGSNIKNDGTLMNHGFMHPIYMLAIEQNINIALMFSLAQIEIPEAIFHNADIIYYALTDLKFDRKKFLDPGGTIYQKGASEIYFPEGNDWGNYFPMYFGQIDVLANIFEFDSLSSSEALYWSKLHNQKQLDLQNRSIDGKTYQNESENNYRLKEERISQIISTTFLAKWIDHQNLYDITSSRVETVSDIYKPLKSTAKIKGYTLIGTTLLLFVINFPIKFTK